jgi:chitodextrinase
MKRLKILGVFLCVVVLSVVGVSGVRAQEEDVTPPELVDFNFTPTEIDTSGGPQEVTVTLQVTDDLSGVNYMWVRFGSPSGEHSAFAYPELTSGDEFNGTWTGVAEFAQYSELGTWTVGAKVQDAVGNQQLYSEEDLEALGYNIYLENGVNEPPVADAGADQTVILGETVNFDGSGSYDLDGTIVAYDWDFGDSNSGSGETTTHDYLEAGEYTVALTVTDDDGDVGTDTVVVIIQTPQEATEELIADVEELELPPLSKGLLKVKLRLSIYFLNRGRIPAAKLSLYSFIWQVERLARRGLLTEEVASGLVTSAQQIIGSI